MNYEESIKETQHLFKSFNAKITSTGNITDGYINVSVSSKSATKALHWELWEKIKEQKAPLTPMSTPKKFEKVLRKALKNCEASSNSENFERAAAKITALIKDSSFQILKKDSSQQKILIKRGGHTEKINVHQGLVNYYLNYMQIDDLFRI
jgi:hypothetical protein